VQIGNLDYFLRAPGMLLPATLFVFCCLPKLDVAFCFDIGIAAFRTVVTCGFFVIGTEVIDDDCPVILVGRALVVVLPTLFVGGCTNFVGCPAGTL
jgi:hypothetical protein